MTHDTRLLGGLTPLRFLSTYWQKKASLVRSAIEDFSGLLDPAALMRLAQRDGVESRIVIRHAGRWEVRHGPFSSSAFRRLPKTGWTLLVQDVNHFLPQARSLLSRFSFIPHARLDDLMVSYAPPGGGVGPHFDSYDVFLLQGSGRRRWRISRQKDRALVEGAPLKLLANFDAEQEWVLEAGDMLYLPPEYAHDGIAVDECMTYSIGFRAPAWHELGTRFLDFLHDELVLDGRYADPHLRPSRSPGRLPGALIEDSIRMLGTISWRRRSVVHFLGKYLTEPKPHVWFTPPVPCAARNTFEQRVHRRGVVLALRTRMLYSGNDLYLNGEHERLGQKTAERVRLLADDGRLELRPGDSDELMDRLYEWYRAGFVEIGVTQRRTDERACGSRA